MIKALGSLLRPQFLVTLPSQCAPSSKSGSGKTKHLVKTMIPPSSQGSHHSAGLRCWWLSSIGNGRWHYSANISFINMSLGAVVFISLGNASLDIHSSWHHHHCFEAFPSSNPKHLQGLEYWDGIIPVYQKTPATFTAIILQPILGETLFSTPHLKKEKAITLRGLFSGVIAAKLFWHILNHDGHMVLDGVWQGWWWNLFFQQRSCPLPLIDPFTQISMAVHTWTWSTFLCLLIAASLSSNLTLLDCASSCVYHRQCISV